jgi:hypothetical protein
MKEKRLGLLILGLLTVAFSPLSAWAGSLDPSGPPAPTMKTLDQIPPTWDRKLAANDGPDSCNSSRFTCVMGGAAVRDNETGLVWEQSPANTNNSWFDAISHCATRQVAGRRGWHLAMLEQLTSLGEFNPNGSGLPVGHPFNASSSAFYWSATTLAENPLLAWGGNGNFSGTLTKSVTTAVTSAWCVRGGQSFDGNTHNTLH